MGSSGLGLYMGPAWFYKSFSDLRLIGISFRLVFIQSFAVFFLSGADGVLMVGWFHGSHQGLLRGAEQCFFFVVESCHEVHGG